MPEPTRSDFGNIRRSRFGDLLRLGTAPQVFYQTLQQLKRWPGGNQGGGDGTTERVIAPFGGLHVFNPDDPQYWDGTGLPNATYRQNFRKRYLSNTATWNQEGVSYSESSGYSGAGYVPITNGGMPTGISDDHPPILDGSETRPFKFPKLSSTAIRSLSGINIENYSFTDSDFHFSDDSQTYHQFAHYSYGTEMPFADMLARATSRLALRHFPTTIPTVSSPEQNRVEYFDEYGVTRIGDTNPAHYTGNPTGEGAGDGIWILPPIHSVNNHERLQSFWGVQTSETWAVTGSSGVPIPANPAQGGTIPIIATRTRFWVDRTVSYWIAKARWMDAIYSGGPISSGRIVDVSLLYSGIAFPGEPVEIPVHPDDGDAKGTHGGLSCGALCFAILDESPESWSSRTGIPI
jgi:hypothetical protein